VPHWDLDAYAPAGAMVSSTRELSRLASAMLGALDTSVKPALARSMGRVVWDDQARNGFGLAWLLELRAGRQLVSHAGITFGFQAFIGINAEKNLGVVILSNDVSPIEPLSYALLNGKKLPVRRQEDSQPEIRLTIHELDSYVGHYQLEPSLVIEVRRDEDMLVVQLTGQESLRVYAEAKDRFFYRAIKAQYTFERDSTGAVKAVVLHQNGRDLRAPRT
jgi:D-alanyl-D-alanine-carboxypeptidase/D-alanyl-D-alanine-endopeptidase